MTWTLRRILIVIVILSTLAVAGTLYWVTATYQRFAIDTQRQITASTVAHLVRRQVEDDHQRKVNPFINEWSRLSTLVRGMQENDAENVRIAVNRMMLTPEVAEGRVKLRNVVIYSKDMDVVATADKGTGESLSSLPILINELRGRDNRKQRQIASYLWRGFDERPLHSTVAPIGGFQVAGFVEFVTDPIPDLVGVGDAVQGHFRLTDVQGTPLFESNRANADPSQPRAGNEDTLSVPITDALGDTWAIATLTRDVSGYQAAVSLLRNQALGIVAAVILGSVLIGWLMLRLAVFGRLRDFASVMEMLAEGKTDVQIPSVGPDEFKNMRASLESLKNAVKEREEATIALRESEQRVRAIIDNSPNAIYLKDTQGRITLANTSVARRLGFEAEKMIGQSAYDHLPERLADILTAQEKEVLKTGQSSQRELEFTSEGREPYIGLMEKFPVFDADGVITGVGTITVDISRQKRAEKELLNARLQAEEQAKLQRIILDNVGQGILVFHADTQPLLWNELAMRFTGLTDAFRTRNLTLEECNEFQFREFTFDEATIELVSEFDRRMNAGERDFVVSYQRRGIDGATWVQVNLRSLSDGMIVQTYQDITDLRQALDAARQTQRLAEDANRAKSDFLSNMSHELRTPLNAIIGFTEFVIENDEEPITHEQSASLSQVLKAGRHLLVLINDVLDLSKIEAGAISLSIEAVDPGQVIDECVSLTASFAAGRNVVVKNLVATSSLPAIEVDRIRFKQVFLNLLSNAIKYNLDSGSVHIERAPSRQGMLRIGVRDDGPGISQDKLVRLFEPFDRLGAENSIVEGTGIGLTITKSLVDQMGCEISVDSVVGKGSTFWLDMPISETVAEHRIDADEFGYEQVTEVGCLILYIEDNPANLELVRKIMSRQPGIDFIDAPTGELGIERARAEVPDVILLDINLPGMDGFEVLDVLSTTPETRHIPIVALTAAATDDDKKRGQASGFFSYLTKPIAARQLMTTIRRALRPASMEGSGNRSLQSNGRVLVVDDMAINLSITQKQLGKLGIPSDIVEDPVLALEMLENADYAVALIDIGMPIMNGMELTRRLREVERQKGRYTPVIALTASYGSEEDVGRYRKAGMDGQLTKPVILNDLASTLHRWFYSGSEATEPSAAAETGTQHEPEKISPPVDLEKFKEILGTDDGPTIQEMFDLFVASIPDELDALSSAISARQRSPSREVAHRFKSAALNAAADRLSELLQEIENGAEDGNWEELERSMQLVREEYARVRDFMQAGA